MRAISQRVFGGPEVLEVIESGTAQPASRVWPGTRFGIPSGDSLGQR
jgi:hypothetical protein